MLTLYLANLSIYLIKRICSKLWRRTILKQDHLNGQWTHSDLVRSSIHFLSLSKRHVTWHLNCLMKCHNPTLSAFLIAKMLFYDGSSNSVAQCKIPLWLGNVYGLILSFWIIRCAIEELVSLLSVSPGHIVQHGSRNYDIHCSWNWRIQPMFQTGKPDRKRIMLGLYKYPNEWAHDVQ